MSEARPRGRPVRGTKSLSRSNVLASALGLLNANGERGLTMRALARKLSVTPMALYHHVGNRDELIAALIEHVFGGIGIGVEADRAPEKVLENLLGAYCHRASEHPELILAVLRDPNTFGGPLSDLTELLQSNLQVMGLSEVEAGRWLGLLVDYTHGYAVSEVANRDHSEPQHEQLSYQQNIRLLTGIACNASEKGE